VAADAEFDVIVIGGGITGAGVVRDAAMRGLRVLLLERRDFASGTTGASMGMLHGGLRYLLYDPEMTHTSCVESGIIQRLAPHLVFRIPWLFPLLPGSHARIVEAVVAQYDRLAPLKNSSPHVLLTAREAREVEPALTERIEGALSADEPGVNPFRLVVLNLLSAVAHGAVVRNHAEVVAVEHLGQGQWRVRVREAWTGREWVYVAPCVVNAGGPWAPWVAALAGVHLRLRPTKGTHIIFDRHVTSVAVNTGDVSILPHESTALCGLTDTFFEENPDRARPEPAEAESLLSSLEKALPAIRQARVIRAMAGVRPLIDQPGDDPRDLTRRHLVLDHAAEGADGFISVVGGKMVTYRLMAEEATGLACQKLGREVPCQTAEEPLPGGEAVSDPARLAEEYGLPLQTAFRLVTRHGAGSEQVLDPTREAPWERTHICICEPVTQAEVRHAIRHEWARTLDDLRRRTRLGTGPCQGFGCTARAVTLLAEELGEETPQAWEQMRAFLQERWKGRQPVLAGQQLPQEELTRALYLGLAGLGQGDTTWGVPAGLKEPLPAARDARGRRVVVVGGGVAGAMAALAARSLGASVTLVRQGYGATALSSGALDWPSDLPPDGAAQAALQVFRQAMEGAGLPYQGAWDQPVAVPTSLGNFKTTALVPASVWKGRLSRLEGQRLLVVGVRGLAEFHAPFVAQALAEASGGGLRTRAVEIELPGTPHQDNLTPFEVAQALDRPEVAAQVGERVGELLADGDFGAAAWPAVVGLDRTGHILQAWEATWGVPAFETLSGPPSLPGFRLQQALDKALQAAGVELLPGTARGVQADDGSIQKVQVAWRVQEVQLPADAVVWATGRFVGGGLKDQGRLAEPALGLPLTLGGRPLDRSRPWELTGSHFEEPQPLFQVAVSADPLGRRVFRNLWVAGALTLGRDYVGGEGQGGLCLVSGFRAGWCAACGPDNPDE